MQLNTGGIITTWGCDLSGPTESQNFPGVHFLPFPCSSPLLHLYVSMSVKNLCPMSLKCVIISLSPLYSHLGKWP